MAREQAVTPAPASWTKIFTTFKIALDIKKLLLAAAGILLTFLGWWLLGVAFYNIRSFPEFEDNPKLDRTERLTLWNAFKARRKSWNLLHELAGPPIDRRSLDPARHDLVDAADVASDLDEYDLLTEWEKGHRVLSEPITIKDKTLEIRGRGQKLVLAPRGEGAEAALARMEGLTLRSLQIKDSDKKLITINGVEAEVVSGPFDDLRKYREEAFEVPQIEARAARANNPKLAQRALLAFQRDLSLPKLKASGRLRTLPWFEYRGENPYLIVSNTVKTTSDAGVAHLPSLYWLFNEQAPVLLEPLFRFLMPVVYLFHPHADFLTRLYLILVMVWALAVWGFFGGAICRIAAMQIARNERITLKEAVLFTRERYVSYLVAPLFPMALLAIMVLCLIIFGWLEWTPYIGDIFAGLFWPIVLLLGFIMAVVMVGLVGWPLMNATISTEGSDSFDALSRSYSYIYGSPWRFVWYSILAIVYGAVLVFFIGFMASLVVFAGKWGVGSAPGLAKADPAYDREPSYLFYYAPTSFGWRDLLISNSQHVYQWEEITPSGHKLIHNEFKPEYVAAMGGFNRFGAAIVTIWTYLFFLLVVGFSYSYFWSASTMIYFLMRHSVDDTDMEEVYLDDESADDPFMKPAAPTPTATPPVPAAKPGTMSLNVIESPAPAAPLPMAPLSAASSPMAPPPPSPPFPPTAPLASPGMTPPSDPIGGEKIPPVSPPPPHSPPGDGHPPL